MNGIDKQRLDAAADNVRILCLDQIEAAGSGHPGLPLGLAEFGVFLFSRVLKYRPDCPDWIDRDRFVLSGGHGSSLLYALLHLSGYELSLDDLRKFRQLDSKTPGHPEFGTTPGIETTTGPLGQGISSAVGMAAAERLLAVRFNTPDCRLIDHYTYVVMGEGDLMEGVTYEACSLAGHLGLGKLIAIYDANAITIDGPIEMSFSEDVAGRFASCGWQILSGSAYDYVELERLIREAKADTSRPTLIQLESVIGKGSPGFAGTAAAHGGTFGADEVAAIKERYGYDPKRSFQVRAETYELFARNRTENVEKHEEWVSRKEVFFEDHPEQQAKFHAQFEDTDFVPALSNLNNDTPVATRIASGIIVDQCLEHLPGFLAGSADLTVPCFGQLLRKKDINRDDFSGNYLNFGIREHAMGAVSNGLVLHGGFRVCCATFLAFSDYLRPSLRLAALMRIPVIYAFSHDSVWIGQDGPTHQSVEHLAALRLIPRLRVIRPSDAEETAAAWQTAIRERSGPCALILARQDVHSFPKPPGWKNDFSHGGAYTVISGGTVPSLVIIATGSEVQTVLEAMTGLNRDDIRVVSMPARESFLASDAPFRNRILPPTVPRMVVEAGVRTGWEALFASSDVGDGIVSIDRFGMSARPEDIRNRLEFGSEQLRLKIRELLSRSDNSVEAGE